MASKPTLSGAPLTAMTETASQSMIDLRHSVVGHGPDTGLDGSSDNLRTMPIRGTARGTDRRRVAVLARALEADVIPRLLLTRRTDPSLPARHPAASDGPTQADILALTDLAMAGDTVGAAALVAGVRARDIELEQIYLDLLAPVARQLGELWTADRCDFSSVTIGLCCLQQLILDNNLGFGPRPTRRERDRHILLAPVPGEQHSFGLLMVSEFFRRHGWDVCSGTGASSREIVALARKQWFSVVGFSMGGDTNLDALATLIRDIRRASRNPQIGILVGGRVFADRPDLAALVGADATASDGQQAVLKAETLLALLVREV